MGTERSNGTTSTAFLDVGIHERTQRERDADTVPRGLVNERGIGKPRPARRVDAVDGVAVYAGAGYAVRPLSYGVEDFLALPSPPPGEEVVYSLDVRRAPGLRAVGFGLEVLDAGGAPRLRMEPPYVVGARGERVAARFDVRGCAVDTSPAPPWGRPVVRPGADVCTMHVRWEGVSYPALLDPKWLGSSSQVSRIGHVALRLASGRVVFGYGESCDSQACRSVPGVHLYDPVTDSIANMGGADERGAGRSGVVLPNGKVLTLGGTPELFDPSNGQYTTTGPMGTPHSGAQLVRLASGKILVVGGGVAASSLYDAATPRGRWSALPRKHRRPRRAADAPSGGLQHGRRMAEATPE